MHAPTINFRRQAAIVHTSRALFTLRKALLASSPTSKLALLDQAFKHCDAAIESDATYAEGWLVRSSIHLALGNREAFGTDFLQGSKLVHESTSVGQAAATRNRTKLNAED